MEQPEGDFRLRKMFQHDERDLSIMQRSLPPYFSLISTVCNPADSSARTLGRFLGLAVAST